MNSNKDPAIIVRPNELVEYLRAFVKDNFKGNQAEACRATKPYGAYELSESYLSMVLLYRRRVKPEKLYAISMGWGVNYIELLKKGGFITDDLDYSNKSISSVDLAVKNFPVVSLSELQGKVIGTIPYIGDVNGIVVVKLSREYFDFIAGDTIIISESKELDNGMHYVLAEDLVEGSVHIYRYMINGDSLMITFPSQESIVISKEMKNTGRFKFGGVIIGLRRSFQ